MRRAIYIINLVLLVTTAVVVFALGLGFNGFIVLWIVQPICAFIYWTQMRTLSRWSRFRLRIYLCILGLLLLSLIGGNVLDIMNWRLGQDVNKGLSIVCTLMHIFIPIYFTYITYIISKESAIKLIKRDTDILDADLIEEA